MEGLASNSDLRPGRAEALSRCIIVFAHACEMALGTHEFPILLPLHPMQDIVALDCLFSVEKHTRSPALRRQRVRWHRPATQRRAAGPAHIQHWRRVRSAKRLHLNHRRGFLMILMVGRLEQAPIALQRQLVVGVSALADVDEAILEIHVLPAQAPQFRCAQVAQRRDDQVRLEILFGRLDQLRLVPADSKASSEDQNEKDDDQDPDHTDPAISEAIAISTEATAKAAKEEDDENDEKNGTKRHDVPSVDNPLPIC